MTKQSEFKFLGYRISNIQCEIGDNFDFMKSKFSHSIQELLFFAKGMVEELEKGGKDKNNGALEFFRSSEYFVSPPCTHCKFFYPKERCFSVVQWCHAEEQFQDFSCFKHHGYQHNKSLNRSEDRPAKL